MIKIITGVLRKSFLFVSASVCIAYVSTSLGNTENAPVQNQPATEADQIESAKKAAASSPLAQFNKQVMALMLGSGVDPVCSEVMKEVTEKQKADPEFSVLDSESFPLKGAIFGVALANDYDDKKSRTVDKFYDLVIPLANKACEKYPDAKYSKAIQVGVLTVYRYLNK